MNKAAALDDCIYMSHIEDAIFFSVENETYKVDGEVADKETSEDEPADSAEDEPVDGVED
jgi:hypothetical protein